MMLNLIKQFLVEDDSGQGLVEYALLISLVALAVIAAIIAFGGRIGDVFNRATNAL